MQINLLNALQRSDLNALLGVIKEIHVSNFKKQIHNPLDLIKSFWPTASTEHITYDPSLKKGDYNIIRQSGGDGTLLFTVEMLQKGLIGIVNMHSFYLPTEPDWSKVVEIKYTIGSVKHATVFGMIKLRCSETRKYTGQKERTTMPVRCEYVYA